MSEQIKRKLAPSIVLALKNIGIDSIADLKSAGSLCIFLLLKDQGLSITNSVLWRLIALEYSLELNQIDLEEKKRILSDLKKHPVVRNFPNADQMKNFMELAIQEAKIAFDSDEVPVGCLIVYQNQIIASSHNSCLSDCCITSHAELNAIKKASQILKSDRLSDCDMYITLEPCTMCSGAIIQSRIKRLVFAAKEPKMGSVGSVVNIFENHEINHHTAVLGGVLEKESIKLMKEFFAKKRILNNVNSNTKCNFQSPRV